MSNAIFGAMNDMAVKIALVDKVASVEDVDRAVMIHLNMPIGTFRTVGLRGAGYHLARHARATAKISGDPGRSAIRRRYSSGSTSTRAGWGSNLAGVFTRTLTRIFKRPEFLGRDPE